MFGYRWFLLILGSTWWWMTTTGACSRPTGSCESLCVDDSGSSTDALSLENSGPEPVQDAIAPRKPAVSLFDHQQWKVVGIENDPYASLKQSKHTCDLATGKKIEEGVLEIDTDFCNFITLEQPSVTEIRAGEMVEFVMWHLELFASTPGEAFVSIRIADQVIWEKTIPVPFRAEIYQPQWTPAQPIPKGSRIVFHLHNHGANTWKIHSLTTGVPF